MDVAVGIGVAKEFHWAVVTRLDASTGRAVSVLNRRVDNVPSEIAALFDDLLGLAASVGSVQVGIDPRQEGTPRERTLEVSAPCHCGDTSRTVDRSWLPPANVSGPCSAIIFLPGRGRAGVPFDHFHTVLAEVVQRAVLVVGE
jgi:hypothetical protein